MCYCVQSGDDFCFHYRLADDKNYNCNDILTIYRDWLKESTLICLSITIFSLIYFISLCKGGCLMSGDFPVQSVEEMEAIVIRHTDNEEEEMSALRLNQEFKGKYLKEDHE